MFNRQIPRYSPTWPIVDLRVFGFAFTVILVLGLSFQLIVLPLVLPQLHAGHGLLKGGDWVVFHAKAIVLAEQIGREGWGGWHLFIDQNSPIAITAAVYAITGAREPWAMMPINAALFALGATALFGMYSCFAPRRVAFIALLPYLFFPSAVLIYGQIHKDVFSIAGLLLIAFVCVRLVVNRASSWGLVCSQALLCVISVVLVWVARPYLLWVLWGEFLLVGVVALACHVRDVKAGQGYTYISLVGVALLLIVTSVTASGLLVSSASSVSSISSVSSRLSDSSASMVSRAMGAIYTVRANFAEAKASASAGSNVDVDVRFSSVADVLVYVPRALQIGLFAPFPSMWGGEGVSPGARQMRLLAGCEMAITYLLLPGVVMAFFQPSAERRATVVMLLLSLSRIILIAILVCNVGAIYRMRYASLQLLVGLGIIGYWGMMAGVAQATKSRVDC